MASKYIEGTKNIVCITKFYQKTMVGIALCLIFGVIGNSKANPITDGLSELTNYPLEDNRSNSTLTQYLGDEFNKNEAQNSYSLRLESVDSIKMPSYINGSTKETNTTIKDLSSLSKSEINQDSLSNKNIYRRRKRNNMETKSKQLNKAEFSKYNNSRTPMKKILPKNFTKFRKSDSQYNQLVMKNNPQQFNELISEFKEKNIKKRFIGIESSAGVEIIINPEYDTQTNDSIIIQGFNENVVKKRSVGIESSADVEIVINPEYDIKPNESDTCDNEFYRQNITELSEEQISDDSDYQNDQSESDTDTFHNLSFDNSSFFDSKPYTIKNVNSNQPLKSKNSTRYDPKIPIKMQNFLSDIAVELMSKNSNLNLINTPKNAIINRDKINQLNSTEILMVIKRFIDKKMNGDEKKLKKNVLQQFKSYLKNNPSEINILKSNFEEKTAKKRFVMSEPSTDVEIALNSEFETKQNESATNRNE